MQYRLEWNQGYLESNTLTTLLSHPQFTSGTLYERISFGWLAI